MHLIKLTEQPLQDVSHDPGLKKRILLNSGIVPAITQLATTSIAPNMATRSHVHRDVTEVFVILEGTAQARIDGREVVLQSGDCLVVEPGEAHALVNVGAVDLRLLYFGARAG